MAIANINQYGINLGTNSNNSSAGSKLKLNSDWVNAGVYPVGSIYFSVSSTINTPNQSGGAKTVTLTTNTIPSHRHNWSQQTKSNASGTSSIIRMTSYTTTGKEGDTYGEKTGGDAAHNNLQPYITCYIWLRTA